MLVAMGRARAWSGTYTALVTPFREGRIDELALKRLIELQIRGGVDGLVPVGTTGESATLDYDEHIRVIELTVQAVAGRVRVMAGTGANSTREAIELTRRAEAVGADAALLVAPYYNRPTQEGLFQHFREVARATRLPLFLYNIPSRCGVEIGVETVQRLAQACPNVVGIKEAGGNADRVSQLRSVLGTRFVILSGDDALTLPFMAVGAEGVVSVASNVIPREVSRMVRAFAEGRVKEARRLHLQFYPLFKDLFLETNPIPVKAALAMMGLVAEEYRLPLVPMAPANRERLVQTLKKCGVLRESGRALKTSTPREV
ncbi:MAG: 4-hydroxy-tetrahydrodipicolinate synthase [Verrucomicrobiota bacterium]|nr:4-hydroxy-tetrahydrodipicolinate synthase [Limisphaera sp.]MDW8383081.1 4-hydroxy-tetrahydrodipicolinate synthase [Verrucomicrobiota bacterium]